MTAEKDKHFWVDQGILRNSILKKYMASPVINQLTITYLQDFTASPKFL